MKITINSGFSLIEVMVAVLLLSFGMLGIAALQISTKSLTYDSFQRTVATQLTQDIIERIRVNPEESATTYAGTYSYNDSRTKPSPDCGAVSCTSAELAVFDLWEWRESLLGATEQIISTVTTDTGGLEKPIACLAVTAVDEAFNISVTMTWQGVKSIPYTGASTCGNINTDDTRRIITLNAFVSTKGIGL